MDALTAILMFGPLMSAIALVGESRCSWGSGRSSASC